MQDAIILLAGQGTRLKPLTNHSHKALIQIGGQSILARQIEALQNFGIRHFHCTLGHRADDLRSFLAENFPKLSVQFYENPVYALTNTGYSLWTVTQKLKNDFLLLDGDVIFEPKLLQKFKKFPRQNVILCETDRALLDEEAVKFRTNAKNEVTQIGKEIAMQTAAGESIGIGQFRADLAQAFTQFCNTHFADKKNWHSYYEDIFQHLLNQQQMPTPLLVEGTKPYRWVEVDDHDDLQRAKNYFAK